MRIYLTRVAALVGLCMLVLQPLAASANDPCATDAAKFCAGVEKGDLHVVKCLIDHEAQLSDPCKARLARVGAQPGAHQSCAADAANFCKGINPGGGRIAKCLDAHEAALSDACKKARAASERTRTGKPESTPAPTAKH